MFIYICHLGKFVCSRKANKPFKSSKIWSKSPYHGTVYYFPDTITSTGRYSAQHFMLMYILNIFSVVSYLQQFLSSNYLDPTAYRGVKYVGQEVRKVWDYRVDRLISIKAHLYKVKFTDSPSVEFRLNPEFSLKDSKLQAKKYGKSLGRIPQIFRARLDSFAIHKGK